MNSIKSFFQELFYSIPTLGVMDIVDILVVAFIIYKVMLLIRSTSTARVARSILLLLVMTWLTDVVHMYALNWILTKIIEVGVIALVIVFQPELRRVLERFGGKNILLSFTDSSANRSAEASAIEATVQACEIMARERVGVLLVFERQTSLDEYFKTGTLIDAKVTDQLLRNLFFKNSPLHDGAVIIRHGRVAAAGCVLPLSGNTHLSSDLGTRHRHERGLRRCGRHRFGGNGNHLRRHRRNAQAPSCAADARKAPDERAAAGGRWQKEECRRTGQSLFCQEGRTAS